MELLIDLKSVKLTKRLLLIHDYLYVVNSTKYVLVKVYFIRLQLVLSA